MLNNNSVTWSYWSLFIHSTPEAHLGSFQVLTIMNKVAINIICGLLCGHKFSTPLCKYEVVQLLVYMRKVCLVCKRFSDCPLSG